MLNECRLIGRLGADPEIRQLDGGKNVASMSVATYRSFKKDDKWEQITHWHRVIVWNSQESVEKLKKGNMVLVLGEIQTRTYTDKDGIGRSITEVVGRVKTFPKTEGTVPHGGEIPPPMPDDGDFTGSDDMPF